ncbi:MAG TPA: hypothetical protein VK897_00185 [Anaerolineales bacterium]|nr:hypothetical protein [Anaerolineales bacterium]
MKKLFILGCLILLSACQPAPATSTPETPVLPTATIPPTPVPVTNTPQPTPTSEPTSTPFPRFFTDEFDASLTSWAILQAGSDAVPSVKTENSTLLLQMDAPFNWVYAVFGAQDYENVRVDARFANQAGSPASIGLVCRYSESDGWFEYNISTDGTYNVLYGQWLADGVADYLPILSASSTAIQPSGTSQEIGLICSGTILSLFIDQTLIRNVDVSRYELTGGKVGVTASSFENTPVLAAFDWLRVSEP